VRRVIQSYGDDARQVADAEAALNTARRTTRRRQPVLVCDDTTPPKPKAPAAEAALRQARGDLDVAQAAYRAGASELLVTVNAAAVEWRHDLDAERVAVTARARAALDTFTTLAAELSDLDGASAWLDRIAADGRGDTRRRRSRVRAADEDDEGQRPGCWRR
jgi:hypothetical protein